MKVSVIIPIYNCSDFLEQAVLSAVHLPEVGQIVLIEDGSTDNSLSICRNLSEMYDTVTYFVHKGKAHKGRSASRNLGLKKCTEPWVAFLDADDYYLSNRFNRLLEIQDQNLDGIYESIKSEYTQIEYSKVFPELITAILNEVSPDELLDYMVQHNQERISLLGLTVRRELLYQIGGFDESLNIGEDTDLIWRLANICHLEGTRSKEPVAIRRVHGRNSYFNKNLVDMGRHKFYKKWILIMNTMKLSPLSRRTLIRKYLSYIPLIKKYENVPIVPYFMKLYFFLLYQFRINLH